MKKLKGIILVVILSLASILMPFNIYADTITTANIVGVSAVVSDSLVNGQVTFNNQTFNTYYVNYDVEIIFDQAYLGYVQLTLEYDYYNRDSSGIVDRTNNQTRRVFVNGSSAHINLNILSAYSNAPLQVTYNNPRVSTITTGGTNVTPIGDLADIQQIVEILQNIYSLEGDIEGLENNQLLQLQQVVANTSLANNYLETLTELRQWNFPIESYPIVYKFFKLYEVVDTYTNYYYSYPLFLFKTTDSYNTMWSNGTSQYDQYMILGCDQTVQNLSNLNRLFLFQNINIISFEVLYRTDYRPFTIFKIKFNISDSSISNYASFSVLNNMYIMPIYINYSSVQNMSTDFALRYNLSNKLLNDLDIIANGTTQSNSASSQLEQEASEYSDIADDVIGVEEGLTSNFETSVNQIDLNTGLNGFGGNFMTSATWVRTQFDRLTENTPYGSLVVYGLTLGFALLMLGKVFL